MSSRPAIPAPPAAAGVRPWLGLAGWLALCAAVAVFGALLNKGGWVATLHQPAWHPPAWVFAPVWTVLYATMALAAWLGWRRGGFAMQQAPLAFFLVQLFFNALWSPLFFGLHHPLLALLDIVFLWFALAATIVSFRWVDLLATYLLLPYLAWVSFAAVLNGAICWLNR